MDYAHFNKMLDAYGGIDKLAGISFDNSKTWLFNYHKAYKTDEDGNALPVGKYRYGELLKPSESFSIDKDSESLSMKRPVPGVPWAEFYTGDNPAYFIEVHPIECIQFLYFVDDTSIDTIDQLGIAFHP